MNRTELQERQRPLKQQYRNDAEAARITLSATGTLGQGVSCSLSTGRTVAEAGLHPATGGDGTQLSSGDMLLEALVACAGVTLRSVATSLDIPVTAGKVTADGDLDFRGVYRAVVGSDHRAETGFYVGAVGAMLSGTLAGLVEQAWTALRRGLRVDLTSPLDFGGGDHVE